MRRKFWYLIALSFPFLIPLFLVHPSVEISPGILGIVEILLVLQLVYGGIQYLIFTGGILWWSRNKTATDLEHIAWMLPILFVPLCELGFLVLYLLGKRPIAIDDSNSAMIYWLFGLISPLYGYFYIGLIQLLTEVLKAARLIKD
jgi:hypothetical protein